MPYKTIPSTHEMKNGKLVKRRESVKLDAPLPNPKSRSERLAAARRREGSLVLGNIPPTPEKK